MQSGGEFMKATLKEVLEQEQKKQIQDFYLNLEKKRQDIKESLIILAEEDKITLVVV